MYNEKFGSTGTLRADWKEEGKNIFFLCVLKFLPDGSESFSIYNVFKKYDDAEEAARCYSDGTEIPSKFQSVADRYIIGCEHYCACKYAHTVVMNRVIVAFVISSPIR